MGMAPVAHVLFKVCERVQKCSSSLLTFFFYQGMKFNPKNEHWLNRDRFVLSNGPSLRSQSAFSRIS